MKLIPLSEYVLQEKKTLENILNENLPAIKIAASYHRIVAYTKFLRQPITMEMFYPIHEGTPLISREIDGDVWDVALEKVLFKGWKDGDSFEGDCFTKDFIISYSRSYNTYVLKLIHFGEENYEDYAVLYTVEDLLKRPFGLDWDAFSENFELTPSALKLIGEKEIIKK